MAQDYIMRLLQQVAALLAAIMTKRRNGHIDEAKQELQETCLQTVGLSLDAVKQLSPDALGESQSAVLGYLHAFCLLSDSLHVLSSEEQAIYGPKLDALAAKLDRLPPNPYTTDRIRVYRAGSNA